MPQIKIQPNTVRHQSSKFSQAASDLDRIHWDLNRVFNQLDMEVRSKGNVQSMMSEAAVLKGRLTEKAKFLSEFLATCANGFEEADNQGQNNLEKNVCMVPMSIKSAVTVGVAGGVLAGLISGAKKSAITSLDWFRKILSQENNDDFSAITSIDSESLENTRVQKSWDNDIGKRLANVDTNHYDGGEKFPRKSIYGEGQCTWYCFGRAQEKMGKTIAFEGSGAAGNWLKSVNNCDKSDIPSEIKTNSIAVSGGHVVYIEAVQGETVYFSEANWPRDDAISTDDGVIKSMNVDNFIQERGIKGYIYLE